MAALRITSLTWITQAVNLLLLASRPGWEMGEEVSGDFRYHSSALKSPGRLQSKLQTQSLADPSAWHHPSRLLWPLPFPHCSHPELPCLSQTPALSTLSGLDSTQPPTSLPGSSASEKAQLEHYSFCETF